MSLDMSPEPFDRQEQASPTEAPAKAPDAPVRTDHASIAENDAFLAALYARPRNRTSGRPS
jgi:hypothetical protein